MKSFVQSQLIAWICGIAGLFAFWLVLAPAPASAVPLLWTLNDVTFNNGGTASGSFRFDADTASYSDVAVTTSGAGIDASFDLAAGGNAEFLSLLNAADGPDFAGAPTLRLAFLDLLTNLGGEVGLELNSFSSAIAGCGNADCSLLIGGVDFQLASGSVISEAVTQVSEPGTLSMLVLGLGVLGFKRRREASRR
ncbi:PEP-CTERM sorting domain-containing protein [Denitrobaculum tricleocarpae]|uniref:PEP-CTERM sorting domain-containing protein n=1 Tax=Denitrobaculum tricleocarpae TaxID=2591009 RepID=A0A545TGK6_9PROT|nr:PEP-CTERM sorting domain-containing protein [Denitrobaculum tricleocarpae]TQV76353.1 PEP-CTERM sorting domain-containing protein [Denitrobaculum tricleocarpae]